jgi:ATPase subunit of ABC transporter with duplicated ATPase domains
MGPRDDRADVLTADTRVLDVRALVAGYATPIVGPVSFVVDRGEVVGLTGRNGCGKTTVFNGIVGSARVFGGTIERAPSVRVAFLRQHPVRFPEMPILGAELIRLTGADAEPLPDPLRGLVDMRLDKLSGGQYQLLQVWACLGSPADLVLLDEPTNNMDPHIMNMLGGILAGARGGRKGVLVISHEHEWLGRFCARTVSVGA